MSERATREPLWGKQEVAEYVGIRVGSVPKWIKRHGVPVAGQSDPNRGGVASLYHPADVRAAKAAMPGKGNRTPRTRATA